MEKEEKSKNKAISFIVSSIVSLLIADIGVAVIKENFIVGLGILILAFTLFYFSDNLSQIKTNQEDIKELKGKVENNKNRLDVLYDIVGVKRAYKNEQKGPKR